MLVLWEFPHIPGLHRPSSENTNDGTTDPGETAPNMMVYIFIYLDVACNNPRGRPSLADLEWS
jgi:hypothetical protein